MPIELFFNFFTGGYERVTAPADIDAEAARQLIPQHPAALALYQTYLDMGFTPFAAMLETIKATLDKGDQ